MDNTEQLTYPYAPGFKVGGTSEQAATRIAPVAPTLEKLVLAELGNGPGTPDEIAARIGKSILSVRPRISVLLRLGKIRATSERRKNTSGASANVDALTPTDAAAIPAADAVSA